MFDRRPFLLETLTQVNNNTFSFQQHFKTPCDLLLAPKHNCLPSFEQFIRQQMVQLQDSILECLHYHTFSNMFFNTIPKAYHARILSCFDARGHLAYTSIGLFILLIIFPNFSTLFQTWLELSHPSIVGLPLMCVHTSHKPYGYPPFTLHPWQWVHKNPWWSSWHFCCHCVRCWFSHGMKTITCTSFNHI